MKLTEEQRKAEINKIRQTRAKANSEIEAQILELPKKRMSEELRKAELSALVKGRAKNNADAKAQLIRLGVKYAQRTPPPRLVCDCADCNCENCTCGENSAALEIKEQANEMLDHIQKVVLCQAQPHKKHSSSEIAMSNGMPDSTEIEKVRCEVAEVQGAMNMLARFLASQKANVVDPQPYIQKLAHIEAVSCCQARVPYNAVPHQYVPTTPQVVMLNGQVDNSEIDNVRSEVAEVKGAINSLAKAFDSYNMGKMHGAIETFKGHAQPQHTPTPIIIGSQPQQQAGQPVIINNGAPQGAVQATQIPTPPPVDDQKKSSGLAEMLEKMDKKLNELADDMEE